MKSVECKADMTQFNKIPEMQEVTVTISDGETWLSVKESIALSLMEAGAVYACPDSKCPINFHVIPEDKGGESAPLCRIEFWIKHLAVLN